MLLSMVWKLILEIHLGEGLEEQAPKVSHFSCGSVLAGNEVILTNTTLLTNEK